MLKVIFNLVYKSSWLSTSSRRCSPLLWSWSDLSHSTFSHTKIGISRATELLGVSIAESLATMSRIVPNQLNAITVIRLGINRMNVLNQEGKGRNEKWNVSTVAKKVILLESALNKKCVSAISAMIQVTWPHNAHKKTQPRDSKTDNKDPIDNKPTPDHKEVAQGKLIATINQGNNDKRPYAHNLNYNFYVSIYLLSTSYSTIAIAIKIPKIKSHITYIKPFR